MQTIGFFAKQTFVHIRCFYIRHLSKDKKTYIDSMIAYVQCEQFSR